MNKRKIDKNFDCVAFKRQAQSRIYEETKGMTLREQVAYFRKQAQSGSIGQWWKQLPHAFFQKRLKAKAA